MTDRSVVYRLRADLGQFRAQLAQASASTKKLAGDLTAVGKEGDKTRRGLDSLGGAAGKIGLVAAAGLGAAVIKAADFDSSMSKVRAATHESAGAMDRLREAALQAGADTAFSATEAAAGIENLAKAGVSTEEILSGGLNGALSLAAAGEMEVADAAEAAAGAMAQFKLDGEDVPHIADLLAAGAGKAQGEVSDMVMALKQGGTVASQTGLTIEETAGSFAALAEQSLLGSDAGTSFKQMLAALTPNSEKAEDAMEDLGFSAFDAQGNFVGMVEMAGQLREGLKGMSQEQRMAKLETIFGSDAVRAASIIYDNGADGIAKWIEKVDDAGYAAETAAIKQDNLRGDLEKLGGALETALIGTGEGAQGPLRSLVQGLEDVVNAYNKLPDPAKGGVAAVLGLTALAGGGLWVFSKVVSGIADTRQALDDLGWSGGKTAGALGKVAKAAGIAGGAIAAMSAIDALQKQFEGLDSGLQGTTKRLLDLADATSGGDLAGEFDNIDESFTRLTDPNKAQAFQDSIYETFGFLGSDSRVDEAVAQFEALDAALAGIVTSGSPDQAREAFASLASSMGLSGEKQKELLNLLPQYTDALTGVENEAALTAAEQENLDRATAKAAKAQERQQAAAERQAEALKETREEAHEMAGAFFGLGEKVDKAKVSLNEWLRDMEKQAQALREFTENARTAAKRGLDEGLIKSLEEMGPSGALRMKQLANATDEQIGRANRAWRGGEDAVNDLANAIVDASGLRPKPVTLRVNNEPAITGINAAIDRLKDFKDKKITIRATFSGTAAVTPGFGPQLDMWTGGWTGPGGKYEPKGVVHGDEYVFSKEATHGNVALLERLHKQLRGYASGGLVQRHAAPVVSVNAAGPSIDYTRLAAAMAQVRPLYGDVHVSDGYGGFKRELQNDAQRAGLGGRPLP